MKSLSSGTVAVRREVASRAAFSHVELLLSLAIILLLASIVIGALVRVRDSARSDQCKNNLHNISLAIGNYECRSRVFPIGVVEPEGTPPTAPLQYGYSWTVQLLPFMEQNPLYETIDFHRGVMGQLLTPIGISILRCPTQWSPASENSWESSSYAAAHHHVEASIDVDNLGTFIKSRSIRREQLEDGAHYTIAIGEKLITPDDDGWPWGSSATLRNTGTSLEQRDDHQSSRRPRSSSSRQTPPTLESPIGGFGSEHVWGVNFAFHDASVRLIPFGIDREVLQRLAHRADGELIDIQQLRRIEVPHD